MLEAPRFSKTSNSQNQQDIDWMRHALSLAKKGQLQDEVPVGAVIILENKIIGEGWNQPIGLSDPSAHAEIMALRQAGLHQNNYRLPKSTLYVTLEPCTMCLGAIIHARVDRLVFGAKDPKAGAVFSAFPLIESEKFNHKIDWLFLEELESECSSLLKAFFKGKRKKKIVMPAKAGT